MTGDGLTTDRSCLVAIQPTNSNEDFSEYTKLWDVSTTSTISEGQSTIVQVSCRRSSRRFERSQIWKIASTQAVNIVRLPAAELTPEEQEALPSQSFGEETPTESVGWYTMAILGLVVAVIVFVLLVRIRENDEL